MASARSDSLIDEVLSEVRLAARDGMPSRGSLRTVEPVGSSRSFYSSGCRLRMTFDSGPVDVHVKIHRRDGMGFQEDCLAWATEEFKVLEAVHSVPPEHRPAAVRPLLLLPGIPAVVFEYHPGTPLNVLLRRHRIGLGPLRSPGFEALIELYRRCGAALRSYHDLVRPGGLARAGIEAVGPWEIGIRHILETTDEMASRVASFCRPERRPALEALYREARDGFEARAAKDYPRWGCHGDCTPMNVFVHEGAPTFFDFVNVQLGHPLEDVGRFLAATAFLEKDPLAFAPSRISRLCASFLEGYGMVESWSAPELRFFYQRGLFRTLGGGLRHQKRRWPMSSLYTWGMKRVLERWIEDGGQLPRLEAGDAPPQ